MKQLRLRKPLLSHRARRAGFVILFILLGLSVAWTRAPQEQTVTVEGVVTNGTSEEAVPEDVTVTLHSFLEMEETATYTTTVNADGSFIFDDVLLQDGQTVVARAVYDGVSYVSEFVTLEQDQRTVDLPVTIYETTEDPAAISVAQLHLFVDRSGERIQVGEYAVVGNAGDRTYVGSSASGIGRTWSVRLPHGAENLTFDSGLLGGRFIALDNGFADTRPIPPGDGSVEASFTFELPFQEGVEIEQSLNVPVRAAVLVLPEGDYGLEGSGLSGEDALETEMGAALSYIAGPLTAGERLAFMLVPRTSEVSQEANGRAGKGLTAGIVAVVLAGALIALMYLAPSPGPVPAEVRDQVEAIAALDRDYKSGDVFEKAYQAKRRSLKNRLRKRLANRDR